MIHLIFCLRRLPHLTREEFQRYWRDQHARLVAQHAEILGIRRYVQAHAIEHPAGDAIAATRGAPEAFDGVAEIWFDLNDLMALPGRQGAADAGRALLEDERRFIDLARSPIFLAEDHVVIAGATGAG
jgi:uncharacterized protein (TIGR02118 family)